MDSALMMDREFRQIISLPNWENLSEYQTDTSSSGLATPRDPFPPRGILAVPPKKRCLCNFDVPTSLVDGVVSDKKRLWGLGVCCPCFAYQSGMVMRCDNFSPFQNNKGRVDICAAEVLAMTVGIRALSTGTHSKHKVIRVVSDRTATLISMTRPQNDPVLKRIFASLSNEITCAVENGTAVNIVHRQAAPDTEDHVLRGWGPDMIARGLIERNDTVGLSNLWEYGLDVVEQRVGRAQVGFKMHSN
eukprot:3896188-Amphidinium_carterae.1